MCVALRDLHEFVCRHLAVDAEPCELSVASSRHEPIEGPGRPGLLKWAQATLSRAGVDVGHVDLLSAPVSAVLITTSGSVLIEVEVERLRNVVELMPGSAVGTRSDQRGREDSGVATGVYVVLVGVAERRFQLSLFLRAGDRGKVHACRAVLLQCLDELPESLVNPLVGAQCSSSPLQFRRPADTPTSRHSPAPLSMT